jgi:hypothetical protein
VACKAGLLVSGAAKRSDDLGLQGDIGHDPVQLVAGGDPDPTEFGKVDVASDVLDEPFAHIDALTSVMFDVVTQSAAGVNGGATTRLNLFKFFAKYDVLTFELGPCSRRLAKTSGEVRDCGVARGERGHTVGATLGVPENCGGRLDRGA